MKFKRNETCFKMLQVLFHPLAKDFAKSFGKDGFLQLYHASLIDHGATFDVSLRIDPALQVDQWEIDRIRTWHHVLVVDFIDALALHDHLLLEH